MNVVGALERLAPDARGTVLVIGNFDGVHRGHVALIRAAHHAARARRCPLAAVTFEPHPAVILDPSRAPARLTDAQDKLALLSAAGVDVAAVLESAPALFERSADDFLEWVVRCCRPRAIVEGESFRFGRDREGTCALLRRRAAELGFEFVPVGPQRCAELPGAPAFSSSAIRAALREGRLDEANALLGRPHRVTGVVGGGAGRGQRLGFPTANLERIEVLAPAHAVYVAVAQLQDGRRRRAIVNVGPQPTFDLSVARVEAHLLDFCGDLRGQRLGLYFLKRLRVQQRFADAHALVQQLRADADAARRDPGRWAAAADALALPL